MRLDVFMLRRTLLHKYTVNSVHFGRINLQQHVCIQLFHHIPFEYLIVDHLLHSTDILLQKQINNSSFSYNKKLISHLFHVFSVSNTYNCETAAATP